MMESKGKKEVETIKHSETIAHKNKERLVSLLNQSIPQN